VAAAGLWPHHQRRIPVDERTPTLVAALSGTWRLENPGTGISVLEGALILDIDAENVEHWLYVVVKS
jgi:hypothetical protein